MQLCVRAESILASYLLAKKARSPKSGIVKNPLFFPDHTPTLTLLKYRYPNPDPDPKTKEVPKVTAEVTSENFFECWTVRAEITFISNIVSPMGVRRWLEELTDNSSKFRDHRKHLSHSTITPTLSLSLLKYPYPNLNLTLIPKLRLSVKLDSYLEIRGLNKFSTSCRVPNKCMTLGYSNTAVYVVYAHNAKCRWTDGYRESLKPCKDYQNVVQNDGYRAPAGYRVQHI